MSLPLDYIMKPRSIAVVGASRSANTIGNQILANLVGHGYTGAVYPVNPNAAAVHSIKAYPAIADVPDPVDMAVIVVPKEQVLTAAEECGKAGVQGLVVISAGFREVGGEGIEHEHQLVEIIRRYGMRMVGPNCMGVLNCDPATSMNATFAPKMPPFGRAAVVSQSGAVGASVLDYASEFGIGIAQFVSVGNKPDVSGNDLLIQWENDPAVGLILMYVENFGNPRNFLRIARRITRRKPIIVVKSGRSAVGARAASSHTGALAASDAAVDALLQQAGVLRASSIEEMFDMAMAFSSSQSLPLSRHTAVLTNAGGPGILAADALEAHGLDVVDLSPRTVAKLKPLFPPEASIRNPLDMIASANPAGYRTALNAMLDDPRVSSVVAIFVPPLGVRQEDVAEAIGNAAREHPEKPVLAVLMGRDGLPQGRTELHRAGVPAYTFPESAARALSALCRHQEQQVQPEPELPSFNVDREHAASIIRCTRDRGDLKLREDEVMQLLNAYGIRTTPSRLAQTCDEAVDTASEIGFPVVLKIVAPQIIHKTDVGGVQVGLTNTGDVRTAYTNIMDAVRRAAPHAEPDGVLVQRMVQGGTEIIVGVSRDASFGPLVMFGLGGILVEALHDVSFRVAPLNRYDAEAMIHSIRGHRLLTGVRGQLPADREALIDVLLRVSQLALDVPEIAELDINPLLARPDGVVALDGRILLEITAQQSPSGSTMMPALSDTEVHVSERTAPSR